MQESPHPRAPKSPESLKKAFPALPAQSVKAVSKKSQMTRKWVKNTTRSVFGDFFDTFLTLRAGRPGTPFWDFLGISGPAGVETPVNGDCNGNPGFYLHGNFGRYSINRFARIESRTSKVTTLRMSGEARRKAPPFHASRRYREI